jgi:DNA gyrase inhibitor GyrI
MNLTEKVEIVQWPITHYIYFEKIGPFYETAPQAWNALHQMVPAISKNNQITGYLSLYKVKPQVYRAGLALSEPPHQLPQGMEYSYFKGGKYSKFVLTGSYKDLPEACGRVFEIVGEGKIQMRDDFCMENYTTDPGKTPEDKNITEILIPTA